MFLSENDWRIINCSSLLLIQSLLLSYSIKWWYFLEFQLLGKELLFFLLLLFFKGVLRKILDIFSLFLITWLLGCLTWYFVFVLVFVLIFNLILLACTEIIEYLNYRRIISAYSWIRERIRKNLLSLMVW